MSSDSVPRLCTLSLYALHKGKVGCSAINPQPTKKILLLLLSYAGGLCDLLGFFSLSLCEIDTGGVARSCVRYTHAEHYPTHFNVVRATERDFFTDALVVTDKQSEIRLGFLTVKAFP